MSYSSCLLGDWLALFVDCRQQGAFFFFSFCAAFGRWSAASCDCPLLRRSSILISLAAAGVPTPSGAVFVFYSQRKADLAGNFFWAPFFPHVSPLFSLPVHANGQSPPELIYSWAPVLARRLGSARLLTKIPIFIPPTTHLLFFFRYFRGDPLFFFLF